MFDLNEKNTLPEENPISDEERTENEPEFTEQPAADEECGDNPAEDCAETVPAEEIPEDMDAEQNPDENGDTAVCDSACGEYNDADAEDDEDNLAAVAERITGERHTVAATAAPIRIREETGRIPTVPKATTGIPVREKMERTAHHPLVQAPHDSGKSAKHKKTFFTVISSAVALIVLLTAIIVVVNVTADEKRPADINIGAEISRDAEILTPDHVQQEHTGETTGDAAADDTTAVDSMTEESDQTVTDDPESAESATEASVPGTEPEPVKFTVTIDFFDREDISVVTEAITLGELLTQAGCTLADTDVPSLPLDSVIAADAVIAVDKVEYRTETATETLAYRTEVIEIDTIPRGTTNYLQYGENGETVRTYTVEYVNGVEKNRTLASEENVKWPVNERYELGVGGSFVGADGVTYTYSHRRVVPATYYNIEGLTYLGTMADETVVAVDKDNIPLGTKLYVKNDTFDFGVRIASDIGGKIDEWEVDIWIDKNNPQFAEFAKDGYHYDMEIYYID